MKADFFKSKGEGFKQLESSDTAKTGTTFDKAPASTRASQVTSAKTRALSLLKGRSLFNKSS